MSQKNLCNSYVVLRVCDKKTFEALIRVLHFYPLREFRPQNLYLLFSEEVRVATRHGRFSFPCHLLNCVNPP